MQTALFLCLCLPVSLSLYLSDSVLVAQEEYFYNCLLDECTAVVGAIVGIISVTAVCARAYEYVCCARARARACFSLSVYA